VAEIFNFPTLVFEWVNHHSIFGVSADIPAHFIVGFVVTYSCRLLGMSRQRSFSVLLVLALFKETVIDSEALSKNLLIFEPFKDLFFSCLGAGTGLIFRFPFRFVPAWRREQEIVFRLQRRKRLSLRA